MTDLNPNIVQSDASNISVKMLAECPDQNGVRGIHAVSTGDLSEAFGSFFGESMGTQWHQVKGSDVKIGLSNKFHLVGGFKHSLTNGWKTKIDLSWSKEYTKGTYRSVLLGIKFEGMFKKKIQTVHGEKKDDCGTVGAWKHEWNNSFWNEVIKAKVEEKETELTQINKALMEISGKKYEQTITDWKKKLTTATVKHEKNLESVSKNLEQKNNQFERR